MTAGQTDTDWGRIWDTLPSGFPMYPGAVPSEETSSDPASAVYVVDAAEPKAIATWFQDAFELGAFHTDALSGPFEEGGYLLEFVRRRPRLPALAHDRPAWRLDVADRPLRRGLSARLSDPPAR